MLLLFLVIVPTTLWADGPPSAEELARKAQDPLADVRAIMTDNTIVFGTSDDQTSYGFQIQHVAAHCLLQCPFHARVLHQLQQLPGGLYRTP